MEAQSIAHQNCRPKLGQIHSPAAPRNAALPQRPSRRSGDRREGLTALRRCAPRLQLCPAWSQRWSGATLQQLPQKGQRRVVGCIARGCLIPNIESAPQSRVPGNAQVHPQSGSTYGPSIEGQLGVHCFSPSTRRPETHRLRIQLPFAQSQGRTGRQIVGRLAAARGAQLIRHCALLDSPSAVSPNG